MQIGDVVTLTDARGVNTGKVVQITPKPGIVTVLWDSGVQEQIHEDELTRIGIAAEIPPKKTATLHDPASPPPLTPVPPVESLLTDEDHAVMADEDNSGYHVDDPKHPTFRERLSALWDSRPGK